MNKSRHTPTYTI